MCIKSYGFQHALELIVDNEFHNIQITLFQSLKKANPASSVFLHSHPLIINASQ